uniref:G_PROTEIN_RECEP_F1_2 domain-containing protein n=1 Tax=Steinernema glaseri TaxID=37863 RepID=A0A1I7ZW75_9BILA
MLSPLANMSDEAIFKLMSFYNETKEFEDMIGFIIPTIFAFVIAVGLVGNLLVVIVALNRQMRNSTYTLIIGLPDMRTASLSRPRRFQVSLVRT